MERGRRTGLRSPGLWRCVTDVSDYLRVCLSDCLTWHWIWTVDESITSISFAAQWSSAGAKSMRDGTEGERLCSDVIGKQGTLSAFGWLVCFQPFWAEKTSNIGLSGQISVPCRGGFSELGPGDQLISFDQYTDWNKATLKRQMTVVMFTSLHLLSVCLQTAGWVSGLTASGKCFSSEPQSDRGYCPYIVLSTLSESLSMSIQFSFQQ